jgi:hypothetical protein
MDEGVGGFPSDDRLTFEKLLIGYQRVSMNLLTYNEL